MIFLAAIMPLSATFINIFGTNADLAQIYRDVMTDLLDHHCPTVTSGVYPPRSSGAIPPSEFPMPSFLPLSSVMPSTFSFPSPLISTPALSPFSLPPLLNLGTWIQLRKNLANLDVRTCILMCIIYVDNNH